MKSSPLISQLNLAILVLVAQDLDLNVNGSEESLVDTTASTTDWGVVAAGQTIDIESGTDTIPANATVTIRIGTNASFWWSWN